MKVCRAVFWIFLLAYVLALALMLIGTLGLFGQEQDPLSAAFLIPLGLPWNLWLDGLPEAWLPWLTAAAPALNALILWVICRMMRSAR